MAFFGDGSSLPIKTFCRWLEGCDSHQASPENPDNFLLAHAPKADPAGLIEKLGDRYEVTRTNVKKWCVGSPILALLDALEIILKQHPFEPDQVQ